MAWSWGDHGCLSIHHRRHKPPFYAHEHLSSWTRVPPPSPRLWHEDPLYKNSGCASAGSPNSLGAIKGSKMKENRVQNVKMIIKAEQNLQQIFCFCGHSKKANAIQLALNNFITQYPMVVINSSQTASKRIHFVASSPTFGPQIPKTYYNFKNSKQK